MECHPKCSGNHTKFGCNKDQFTHDIERTHRGNYKNANSSMYLKCLFWKVAPGILENVIKATREGNITIFVNQNYTKQAQD